MTTKTKSLYIIGLFVSMIAGFFIGHVAQDFHLITLSREVRIFECITFLTTILIGIYVPLLVKRWIDDNKSIKSYLVDEVKLILNTSKEIQKKISDSFISGAITQKDKDDINYIFHTIELQLSTFREQFQISFPNESEKLMQNIVGSYQQYKDFLTGGSLMLSTFVQIDDSTYRQNEQKHMKLEEQFKILIQKIFKF